MRANDAKQILTKMMDEAEGDYGVALRMAVRLIDAQVHAGWNPYPDVKPEEDGEFLACTTNGAYLIARYDAKAGAFVGAKRQIVAWRYLPEAY